MYVILLTEFSRGSHAPIGQKSLPPSVSRAHLIFLTNSFYSLAADGGSSTKFEKAGIVWQRGPLAAHIGSVAQISVPNGFLFTDGDGTRKFLAMTRNPANGSEVGLLMPAVKEGEPDSAFWFMLFEFRNVGYITDNDRSAIDTEQQLKNIQQATEEGNKERKEQGWPAFHVTGWAKSPYYDESTHNLTWATIGNSDVESQGKTVNYSVRLLGRGGSMNVDLVLDPTAMDQAVPQFKNLLSEFSFTPGNRYSEFVKGDKVAGYGLAALIAGGAGAAAVKLGLFGKLWKFLGVIVAALWKFLVVIFAAIAGFLRKIFRKISGRGKSDQPVGGSAPQLPDQVGK